MAICTGDDGKCGKWACFNHIGMKPGRFCAKHKEDDMINVVDKTCEFENCNVRPIYNIPGMKIARFCAKHKEDGMINVKNKTCEFENCNVQPTYNIPGMKTARFCAKHKEDGMTDIKNKTCEFENCNVRPNCNIPGMKTARFCAKHKEDDMINVVDKTCEFENCNVRPIYNIPGMKTARFCAKHKEDGMIDIKHKTCEFENCNVRPYYNIPGMKTARFCVKHKENGMIDIKNKTCEFENCNVQPTYNIPGHSPIRCTQHKLDGDIKRPTKKCSTKGCKSIAIYGVETAIHCEIHMLPNSINHIERKCSNCKFSDILNPDGKCWICTADPLIKKYRKVKEERVKTALMDFKSTGIDYIKQYKFTSYDKVIDRSCNLKRPDFVYDAGTHFVVIECDERQHRSSDLYDCENVRMWQIRQALGLPTIFIRYNPDNYKPGDGKRKLATLQEREQKLIKLLDEYMKWKPDEKHQTVYVKYLYYDGWDIKNPKPMEEIEHPMFGESSNDDIINNNIEDNLSEILDIMHITFQDVNKRLLNMCKILEDYSTSN